MRRLRGVGNYHHINRAIFRRTARIIVLVLAVIAAGTFAAVKYIPVTRPGVINRRRDPFWEVAASAGKRASSVPVTFPAHDFPPAMLSGLSVPDMSGRVGKPFYFTSKPTSIAPARTNSPSMSCSSKTTRA